jgi:hypothetical protein
MTTILEMSNMTTKAEIAKLRARLETLPEDGTIFDFYLEVADGKRAQLEAIISMGSTARHELAPLLDWVDAQEGLLLRADAALKRARGSLAACEFTSPSILAQEALADLAAALKEMGGTR